MIDDKGDQREFCPRCTALTHVERINGANICMICKEPIEGDAEGAERFGQCGETNAEEQTN